MNEPLFPQDICILCDLPLEIDGHPVGMVIQTENASVHFDCMVHVHAAVRHATSD